MKKLIFFLLFSIIMLLLPEAKATHIAGADISYKNIGPNIFEFTLTVYRDCFGDPVQPTYKLDYSSVSCNIQGNITLTMLPGSGQEISPVCATDSSTCKGGQQPGIQQYIYKGTFVLPTACSDWVFSWIVCTRNAEITNIVNPVNTCLYIEARLNSILAPANNSPVFNNPPVSFLCKGQGNFINPGTVEKDGDQLSFSVVTPKTGKFTPVAYIAPFSATNPITSSPPFSINSISGDISLFPVNDAEVSVTAILAEERRNGVLIGSVMRDIQLITRDCNNANPVLSGINNTSSDSISICAGQEVCFSVHGSDPNAGQKLKMTWNEPFDTLSSFTVTGSATKPKGNICWKTDLSNVGLYFLTVTLTDDFCPIVGSTTKSYKIRVNPNPVVSLPPDMVIACNQTATLTPVVTVGKPPFYYKWNSGELTSSITKGQGYYHVRVTDANGCRGKDSIDVFTGVVAAFDFQNLCIGQTTDFQDQSFSLAGNIVSWSWNFGDPASGVNNTSTLQNPSHTFTSNKTYMVTLTVTDEFGCQGTRTKPVSFCDIPQPNFLALDSCQQNPMPYLDLTTVKNCNITQYTLQMTPVGGGPTRIITSWDFTPEFPNGFYPNGAGFLLWDAPIGPPDTGYFNVTLIATNVGGCTNSISHVVHINPKPKADILEEDYYFDCSKPDTILHGVILSGKPPFIKSWNTGATTNNIAINSPGIYSFTVTDANTCYDVAVIDVMDPLIPKIGLDPICSPLNPVQFYDSSFTHWGNVEWTYYFGDGTSFTTTDFNQRNPGHLYPPGNAVYNVRMIVKDAKGCIDSTVRIINYKFPDNNFIAAPNPICLGQPMIIESPKGNYIDSLVWSFGNGDSLKVGRYYLGKPDNEPVLKRVITATDTIYSYEDIYTYIAGAGNIYALDLWMIYNQKLCTLTYTSDISVFSSLEVGIDSIQQFCSDIPTRFYASQKNSSGGSNLVNSWNWDFYFQQRTPPFSLILVNSSTLQNPEITFTQNGNYFADLIVSNADGCEVRVLRQGFSVVKLPVPYFCTANNCATQRTQFFYFCNSFPEVVVDSFYWDFGDGNFSNVREPFNIYDSSGTYDVTVKIFNTSFGCQEDTTITIEIFPVPEANFNSDTVCLGQTKFFNDLSIPPPGETIANWEWSFDDGETSTFQNVSHLYADTGTYNVRLVITSSTSGCTDTIIRPVVVRPNPVAGFTMTVNELVSGVPILFIDQSLGGVRWLWHFGDGDSVVIVDPLSHDPQHTYNAAIKTTTIEQIVYNQYNCTDTAWATIDLTIYFILPNAFSPNGDGNNDGFFPTYKGIKDILEFRVYDRWGQLVYDGSGNLHPSWDGKFKGADQPVGVYVYYARALAFNQEEVVLSGKVTLIR